MATSVEQESALNDTAEYIAEDRRQAAYYEREPRVQVAVDVAGLSHPGSVRENNEDHFLAVRRYRGRQILQTSLPADLLHANEDHAYTFAVADGMGGRHFGEIASQAALQTGWDLGGDEIKWAVKMNDREEDDLRRKAEVFFSLIDKALHEQTMTNPRLAGMGTTLTVCYSTGPELFAMHAGDSRAYLYRRGKLNRLTHDHTMGQVLIDSGVVEPDSAAARRMSHVLTNCLGGPEQRVSVDVVRQRLEDDDVLLLCTDGLTDMLTDPEIADVLGRHRPAADASTALINRALQRGAPDNVTALVARYTFIS